MINMTAIIESIFLSSLVEYNMHYLYPVHTYCLYNLVTFVYSYFVYKLTWVSVWFEVVGDEDYD